MSSRNTRRLPEVVRIKRRRNQDSLEALILDGSKNKKLKSNLYVFKLQRTEDQIKSQATDGTGFLPLLHELDESSNTFVIPKQKEEKQEQLPSQLTEMLDSFLDLDTNANSEPSGGENLKKRKRKASQVNNFLGERNAAPPASSSSELDYVYDVYYRDKEIHEYNEQNDTKIGFLKFEQDLEGLINEEEDSDDALNAKSDDEDSNAEDFYKNDYPESDDSEEERNTEDEFADDAEYTEIMKSHIMDELENGDQFQEDEYDDLYDQFYDDSGNEPTDFLRDQLLNDIDDDEDDNEDLEDYDDEDFKRNNFFKSDQHDPLAIHRDRIFGKLEKMINQEP